MRRIDARLLQLFEDDLVQIRAAVVLVEPLKAIVTLTRDGRTASLLSDYRPRAPIVAIAPQVAAAQRLALAWGVSRIRRLRAATVST